MSEQPREKRHATIWGIVNAVLLMSLVTPFMLITFWFLSIPAAILYVKTRRSVFGATVALSSVIGAIFAGGAFGQVILLAAFSLIPGIVMGSSYRQLRPARSVIVRGTAAYVAMFLLLLVAATMLGFELDRSIDATIRESVSLLPEQMTGLIAGQELETLVQLTQVLVPLYIFGTSLLLAGVTHAVARRLLNRMGESLAGLKPMRLWRLPRYLVWYYLIALFFDLFLPFNAESFLSAVIVNIVPILMFVFAVQGIAFLFFIADAKRWGRWLPWAGIALFILVWPLSSAFSLLGVFDTAFPLRERLRKP
ncbi:DUF2232 domain-containing protein [Paenibacillus thermotolerans]|uniref:DUF2232 domain-containing protein n=1 Tax=Paenibacillus thermotolerans TaxID=3027807 RepID=UPI00236768DE|nr:MULTISPECIES: DUF2232 domain-containing protein [unclassified Paenibacillus]